MENKMEKKRKTMAPNRNSSDPQILFEAKSELDVEFILQLHHGLEYPQH